MSITDIVRQFNRMQGKLRISVTHSCQLQCRFCHQEGIDRHWVATHISPEFLKSLVVAYSELGGHYIELTGGEPTTHPRIGNLIEIAAAQSKYLILCTNGLRLDRVHSQIEANLIQQLKISLHATSNAIDAKWLLGKSWDFHRLEANVQKALQANANIQLVYTHTKQNCAHLRSVLDLALRWGVGIQVIDLIASRYRNPAESLGYLGGDESETLIAKHARLDHVVSDRTGAVLKVFKTASGAPWEIKDYHYGLLHTGMCEGCSLIDQCGEGIYGLRVDALGILKPCLLRRDLEETIPTSNVDVSSIKVTLARKLEQMLAPTSRGLGRNHAVRKRYC